MFSPTSQIRVAVLRGGPSNGYEYSLKTGEQVLAHLRSNPDKYLPQDIFISRDGVWHVGGIKQDPHKILKYSDVVFNALHGMYGEGGQVQKILDSLKIPYTGSSSLSGAAAINKDFAKRIYANNNIFTPRHEVIAREDDPEKLIYIFRNYLHPVVVKPNNSDFRKGIRLAHTFEDLVRAVDEAHLHSDKALIEEFVRGREATCGIIENARGEKLYALLPIEIKAYKKNHSIDYERKFKEDQEFLKTTSFSLDEHRVLEHAAKRAHEALGLRHYSRTDMILTPQGKVYVLETSALPPIHKDHVFAEALSRVGWNIGSFIDHVIDLALRK